MKEANMKKKGKRHKKKEDIAKKNKKVVKRDG